MTYKGIIRTLRSYVSLIGTAGSTTLTFSYYARLETTTVRPVRQIITSRGNETLTKKRISKFITGR